MREKLIALIDKARYGAAEMCHEKPSCKGCLHWDDRPHCRNSFIADHLLANGVVVRDKGEWVLGHVEPGYCTPGGNRPWVCPKCGQVMSWRLDKPKENFCPNCGADMTGGERNV